MYAPSLILCPTPPTRCERNFAACSVYLSAPAWHLSRCRLSHSRSVSLIAQTLAIGSLSVASPVLLSPLSLLFSRMYGVLFF